MVGGQPRSRHRLNHKQTHHLPLPPKPCGRRNSTASTMAHTSTARGSRSKDLNTVPRRPKEPPRNAVMEATASAHTGAEPVPIMEELQNGFEVAHFYCSAACSVHAYQHQLCLASSWRKKFSPPCSPSRLEA